VHRLPLSPRHPLMTVWTILSREARLAVEPLAHDRLHTQDRLHNISCKNNEALRFLAARICGPGWVVCCPPRRLHASVREGTLVALACLSVMSVLSLLALALWARGPFQKLKTPA
jgi:hypothetical protein